MSQLHIFDLDGTLCKNNVSFFFGQYLQRQGVISRFEAIRSVWTYSLFLTGKISLQTLHQRMFETLFHKKKLPLITCHVAPFLDKYWETLVHPAAQSFLVKAQKASEPTALFSSSPSFLIEPIARLAGFDSWLGTEYAIDKEEVLCHIALVVDGKKKAARLIDLTQHYGIPRSMTIAYSDGENDLPMLKAAGKSVVFHPRGRLLKHCIDNGWIALQNYWSPS